MGCTRDPETNMTSHLKMDGWNTILSFWYGLFSGAMLVSGSVELDVLCYSCWWWKGPFFLTSIMLANEFAISKKNNTSGVTEATRFLILCDPFMSRKKPYNMIPANNTKHPGKYQKKTWVDWGINGKTHIWTTCTAEDQQHGTIVANPHHQIVTLPSSNCYTPIVFHIVPSSSKPSFSGSMSIFGGVSKTLWKNRCPYWTPPVITPVSLRYQGLSWWSNRCNASRSL